MLFDLTGTNRILVRAGIEALLTTPFPGLQALLESCDISGGVLLAEDIGYLLGPKINAAGRLGKSRLVVQLLTLREHGKARKLASQLTALNEERKAISADNLATILETLSGSRIQTEKCVITRGAKHQGIAGLIASKLVEVYGFPSLVFVKKTLPDHSVVYVGSARSVAGLNIMEILRSCSRWIEQFGGHEMAAGLTVAEANFEGFCQHFTDMARKLWENRRIVAKRLYDIECSVEDLLTEECLTILRLLEPFGPGNPQPIFQDNTATIIDSRAVGRGQAHLQVTIRGRYSNIKGIGF
jgi:single-stranded-DNA-specific exonuclease